jgi:hypothetical protein
VEVAYLATITYAFMLFAGILISDLNLKAGMVACLVKVLNG